MKVSFLFALMVFSVSTSAAVKGPWDRAKASDGVGELASYICMQLAKDGTKIAENVHYLIAQHFDEFENEPNPTIEQITHFLNRNSPYMRCASGKHYMKESFDHGRAYDQLFNVLFFEELLSDDESLWVDINGISLNTKTGEPETVLDYMYERVADNTHSIQKRNEIQSLIETFEQYLDGKRFDELPQEVQQAWLAYAKSQSEKD